MNHSLKKLELYRTKFREILERWDHLGKYKDDTFGEVQEAIEDMRESLILNGESLPTYEQGLESYKAYLENLGFK